MGRYDVCVYCAATGCEDGTAEHARNCPSVTGVYPVDEDDLRMEMCCMRCGDEFQEGDSYALLTGEERHLDMVPPGVEKANVYLTVCLSCKVLVDGGAARDL